MTSFGKVSELKRELERFAQQSDALSLGFCCAPFPQVIYPLGALWSHSCLSLASSGGTKSIFLKSGS